MEAKTVHEILQLHANILQDIEKHVQAVAAGQLSSSETIRKMVREGEDSMLKHLRARLSAARQAKDRGVRGADAAIEHYQRYIALLEERSKTERQSREAQPEERRD